MEKKDFEKALQKDLFFEEFWEERAFRNAAPNKTTLTKWKISENGLKKVLDVTFPQKIFKILTVGD